MPVQQLAVPRTPILLEVLVRDAPRAADWLLMQGARFVRGGNRALVMAPPRPPVNNLEWKGRGSDPTLRALARAIQARDGAILLGYRAVELTMASNGSCTGVVALLEGERIEIGAEAVVIADGGFQADQEMFRTHFGPHPDRAHLMSGSDLICTDAHEGSSPAPFVLHNAKICLAMPLAAYTQAYLGEKIYALAPASIILRDC